MAVTLLELSSLINEGGPFQDRVGAAVLKASVSIAYEDPGTTNHAARVAWSSVAMADPNSQKTKFMRYVLAALIANDANLTLADLTNAAVVTDTMIQNHVNASVNIFA